MTWLLPRLIGVERAFDLLLSGRTFDADEALALGIVSRVTEPDAVLGAAVAYARDLATHCSPTAMALRVLSGPAEIVFTRMFFPPRS